MKQSILVVVLLLFGAWGFFSPAYGGDHRLGLGGHYWKSVDDIV